MKPHKFSFISLIPISIALLLLLIFPQCANHKRKVVTKELIGYEIVCDSLHMRSHPIVLVGDTLISSTYSHYFNYCVSVFRNDSLITVGNIFPIGNGEGESNFIKINSNADQGFNIIDAAGYGSILKRYTHYHINQIIETSSEPSLPSYDLSKMRPLRFVSDNFININDTVILITGSSYDEPDHIFSTIDIKSGDIQPLDFWPKDGFKGHPLPKQSVYTDNAILLKGRNRYLYVCGEERYAFIFTISGCNIKIENELFHDLPDYEETPDGLNYNIRSRSIYRLACDANKDNIYILLIEKNIEGGTAANWTESDHGNEVRVFDWEGNQQSVLKLDKIGSQIKVADNNKILYLFSEDPDNGESEVFSYFIE